MRLRLDFGISGPRKEVKWWQPLDMFPTGVLFEGDRWEWLMYADDPNKIYDKILTFSPMKLGDSRWNECLDFESRFGDTGSGGCECGSIYTSFPAGHMFFCPLWRKI